MVSLPMPLQEPVQTPKPPIQTTAKGLPETALRCQCLQPAEHANAEFAELLPDNLASFRLLTSQNKDSCTAWTSPKLLVSNSGSVVRAFLSLLAGNKSPKMHVHFCKLWAANLHEATQNARAPRASFLTSTEAVRTPCPKESPFCAICSESLCQAREGGDSELTRFFGGGVVLA